MILVRRKSIFTDIKDGYTYILQTKIILILILVGISWGLIGGAYQLLLTIYAEKIFHTNIGILYMVQGAGLMIGSLLVNLYISSNKEKMKKHLVGPTSYKAFSFLDSFYPINLFSVSLHYSVCA